MLHLRKSRIHTPYFFTLSSLMMLFFTLSSLMTSIFTLSSLMTHLFTISSLITSLLIISSLMMLYVLPWWRHYLHFLPLGRLKPEVHTHRPVDGAMQRQHWWSLEPEVSVPVEEALQVQDWWSCRKTQARSSQSPNLKHEVVLLNMLPSIAPITFINQMLWLLAFITCDHHCQL